MLVLSLGWVLWEAFGWVLLRAVSLRAVAARQEAARGEMRNVGGGGVPCSALILSPGSLLRAKDLLLSTSRGELIMAVSPVLLGKRAPDRLSRPAEHASPKGEGSAGEGSLPCRSSEQLTEMEEAWQLFVPGKTQDE